MHPFGKEAETSLEKLFEFFSGCLRRGEWELAQACIPQLKEWQGGGAQKVEEILRAIIACPYLLRWETVGSPHRLAWLWLLVLEKWSQEKIPEFVRSEIEFMLLLEELENDVPENVPKELYQAFLHGHSPTITKEKKQEMRAQSLSKDTLSCLWDLLAKKPRLAQALTSYLLIENSDSGTGEYNYCLQKVFTDFLLKTVGNLRSHGAGNGAASQNEMAELVYSVLSVLPCDPERQGGELRQLCEALWEAACGQYSALQEERVLNCLLRPNCHRLVSLYSTVATTRRKEKLLQDAPHSKGSAELSEVEKVMLELFSHCERTSAWKTIYFDCVSNGKHFLEQVLVTALSLIKREDFSGLDHLLKQEFKPLSRLLLLLGWTHCQSVESAKSLLHILHENKDLYCDSVLKEFGDVLSTQLGVLEWCSQNNMRIPAKELLRLLHSVDCHSALYVLHSLTNLPAMEESRVLTLLQGLLPPPSPGETGKPDWASLVVRRNVVLFQGFCAMKYAAYALFINAHKHARCKDCTSIFSEVQPEESLPSAEPGCPVLFRKYAVECQHCLESVPVMFRLELLENIYSLLFLSDANFADEKTESKPVGPEGDARGVKTQETPQEEPMDFSELRESGKEVAQDPAEQAYVQSQCFSYLNLRHFAKGVCGFLADEVAMKVFLKMMKENLDGIDNDTLWEDEKVLTREMEFAECLNCSITAETFNTRLQRLSKHVSEAQWRFQVVTSNKTTERLVCGTNRPLQMSIQCSGLKKRRRRAGRHKTDAARGHSGDCQNGEISASTSDGSAGAVPVLREQDPQTLGAHHSLLVPMMLSPPESLLISCILRGNFTEAHQVALMFGLESSACCGELLFMERYQEVLNELTQVEQKIESQSAEGVGRRVSSGRSTLQAIGSAAAAGMVFYSISDVADKLLSSPGKLVPTLEENYWLSNVLLEPGNVLIGLLEELSPPGMAAFDLACTHCHLWKTSKQLLETAERRLHSTLESRGLKLDLKISHPEGIRGFPAVLQQISKILNHTQSAKGQAKLEGAEDKAPSPFSCSAVEVLLSWYPTLTEEGIVSQLLTIQRLEQVLHTLSSASDSTEVRGGALLGVLVEQAGLKLADLEAHPVRSHMKQLLRTVDQHFQSQDYHMPNRVDYIRSFFDYINTLAGVLVRSLGNEADQASEVKLGNPLLVLQETPCQLLTHLLFERQVPPDRISSLLNQEELNISISQVIVHRCCESLPLWDTCQQKQDPSLLDGIGTLVRQYAEQYVPDLYGQSPLPGGPSEETIAQSSPPLSPDGSTQFFLTASALNFLKSRSSLLATIACLNASKGTKIAKSGLSSWRDFRGKKEAQLDLEQISRECQQLLKEFPILQSFLNTMSEPVLGAQEEDSGLVVSLCGKPVATLVFSGLHCRATQDVAADAFQQVLSSKDFVRALSILELYGQQSEGVDRMKDIILTCAAVEESEGTEHVFRVKDADLRARVVLQCLCKWALESCLEVLQYCLSDTQTAQELKEQLELKKRELQIYQRILSLSSDLPWSDWQDLSESSTSDPEAVLSIVLDANEFELCEQWVQLHPVSQELLMRLQRDHLLHLLERGLTEEAFQLLESIGDHELCLQISQQALDQRPGLAACHFLTDYLSSHFHSSMSSLRQHEIQAMRIGSKLLLTLPEPARQDYFQLLSSPLLMLEQLLMNMKVDWAAMAVCTLRQLLVGQEAGFTTEDIDNLLSSYARKALDFPYAPRERSRSDSVISLQDILNQTPNPENVPPSPCVEMPSPSTAGINPLLTPTTSRDKEKTVRRRVIPTEFTPPKKTPDKRNWIPDHTQHVCMVCRKERFTMFNRRHHCRRCGRLVCNSCSTRKMQVEGCREEAVRVCDQCYSYFNQESEEDLEQTEATESSSPEIEDFSIILQFPETSQQQHKLTLNDAENDIERSEFYYEQAPSSSLCIAILNLHSNYTVCGQQLIEHCRKLSQGLNNPEVDARLLSDIMKQLLFSAKLMFVKVGRSQDLALCDSYISKVDVLKILVTANYMDVPSLDDILQPAAVTRLRNQLLEAEYYQLAVEVSTKSGLDPSGVWQAWGMATLKAGNLPAARENFGRCLKAPLDLNQLSHGSRLLQEIVQHLESTVKPTHSVPGDDILASLRELEDVLTETVMLDKSEGRIQHSSCYQECLYYLHSYGTNLAIISFYMRHDCMREALLHLLNKESPAEVFLDGIFVPSYESGKLHALENLMETIDASLESWSRYLIASCQHLQKRSFFNILYELQQFMKDHVRAAMTCIRFSTHKAESYVDLGEKQKWLIKAKDHLKTYLQEHQGRSSGRKKSASSFRKKMSSTDVSRHINTIELQIEVTRFLHRCDSSGTSRITGAPPPTLFGNSAMKVDVACKVMLGGKNIEEGFGIAFRVIQDFLLDAAAVYNKAAKRLVKQRQFKEIRQLLKCVSESGAATKNDCDSIILSCVAAADKGPADVKELDSLILETKSTDNKIKAYLLCSKLRSAYLLAVKLELPRASQLVQEVLQAAESAGDMVMRDICRQWLSEHQAKATPRQSRAGTHR
ncbi:zinc finger FYVE domain-containing protein 26 isoform X2 [Amia ocellicauda]|uniref:zinc finger FYVE domain-containing protein 26 isoform X2 n=1 Tax=Amia ocellicauda TaxID=2972642 RepID=UPI003463F4D6